MYTSYFLQFAGCGGCHSFQELPSNPVVSVLHLLHQEECDFQDHLQSVSQITALIGIRFQFDKMEKPETGVCGEKSS